MKPILADLHNHSNFCDGRDTPEQMAEAAFKMGFTDLGFSGHSHAEFDLPCSVRDVSGYLAAVHSLQEEYAGRMNIYCGVEQDFCAPVDDRSAYDYLIGAVHYFHSSADDIYYPVDSSAEELAACISEMFGGQPYQMIRRFYENSTENVLKYRPDLVGHFDLIVKNNADGRFFDEDDKRYRYSAIEALEACLELAPVFELNMGGIYRRYRETPYPATFLLKELLHRGGRIALSADAHATEALAFRFTDAKELLRDIGFKSIWVWHNGAFVEQGLN